MTDPYIVLAWVLYALGVYDTFSSYVRLVMLAPKVADAVPIWTAVVKSFAWPFLVLWALYRFDNEA